MCHETKIDRNNSLKLCSLKDAQPTRNNVWSLEEINFFKDIVSEMKIFKLKNIQKLIDNCGREINDLEAYF
jgi:hypothetical protein